MKESLVLGLLILSAVITAFLWSEYQSLYVSKTETFMEITNEGKVIDQHVIYTLPGDAPQFPERFRALELVTSVAPSSWTIEDIPRHSFLYTDEMHLFPEPAMSYVKLPLETPKYLYVLRLVRRQTDETQESKPIATFEDLAGMTFFASDSVLFPTLEFLARAHRLPEIPAMTVLSSMDPNDWSEPPEVLCLLTERTNPVFQTFLDAGYEVEMVSYTGSSFVKERLDFYFADRPRDIVSIVNQKDGLTVTTGSVFSYSTFLVAQTEQVDETLVELLEGNTKEGFDSNAFLHVVDGVLPELEMHTTALRGLRLLKLRVRKINDLQVLPGDRLRFKNQSRPEQEDGTFYVYQRVGDFLYAVDAIPLEVDLELKSGMLLSYTDLLFTAEASSVRSSLDVDENGYFVGDAFVKNFDVFLSGAKHESRDERLSMLKKGYPWSWIWLLDAHDGDRVWINGKQLGVIQNKETSSMEIHFVETPVFYGQPDESRHEYVCYGDLEAKTQDECRSRRLGTWDRPCRSDLECPYFQKNTDTDNYDGGCNDGHCEFPLGMERTSWRHADPSGKPWCRGCDVSISPEDCCLLDKDKGKDSPSYVFPSPEDAPLSFDFSKNRTSLSSSRILE